MRNSSSNIANAAAAARVTLRDVMRIAARAYAYLLLLLLDAADALSAVSRDDSRQKFSPLQMSQGLPRFPSTLTTT